MTEFDEFRVSGCNECPFFGHVITDWLADRAWCNHPDADSRKHYDKHFSDDTPWPMLDDCPLRDKPTLIVLSEDVSG